jgi:hypothetical protein
MYLHTLGKTIYIYFILYNLMFCLKQNTISILYKDASHVNKWGTAMMLSMNQ